MGILTVYPSMTAARTVATKANAEAAVNGMTHFAAPHALCWVASALLSDSIVDGHADFLDPRSGKGRGDMEGRVDVALEASKGIGPSESGRTPVQRLSFYFE